MHVVLSVAAEADLQEIGDWIALDNPVRAASFVRELREACLTLADMPRAFPVVRRRRAVQIRRKPYCSYLIFYRVRRQTVEILHVLHGARDYDRVLFAK
jgi:plasmid stabilization system protein ParE